MIQHPHDSLPDNDSYDTQRFMDSLLDKLKFDDLYQTAWQMCLDAPLPASSRSAEKSPLHDLTSKLGIRGIGTVYDCTVPGANALPVESLLIKKYATDSLLRDPTAFCDCYDPDVTQKIEAFGAKVINEAYYCLGFDVDAEIERFKTAETVDEQFEVLDWLLERVTNIGRGKTDLDEHEEEVDTDTQSSLYFYHPIRLSPKALGTYPNEHLSPTCLMKSILIASFLERTGANYMNAGVMMTRPEQSANDIAVRTAETSFVPGIAPLVQERLRANARKLYWDTSDNGFHAVCLVQLKDGAWAVLDPNYEASYVISEDNDNNICSQAYDTIIKMHELGVPIERTVKMHSDAIPRNVSLFMEHLGLDELPINRAEISELLTGDVTNILERAKQLVLSTTAGLFGERAEDARYIELYATTEVDLMFYEHPGISVPLFDNSFEEMWKKFVMWDENPVDVVAKCRRDPAYLERRIDDFMALPRLTYLQAGRQLSEIDVNPDPDEVSGANYHTVLELGHPGHRIGAAVLSDVAAFFETDLSPNFWLSQWPSRVPITEHALRQDLSPAQVALAEGALNWLGDSLRYYKQYGIVDKFYSRK